ncbi:MAG: hypothetical protein CMK59_13915 [Proteobacteria bacterium]|nr:hypothetical protein [Pseudomonadota bacterium]
MPFIFFIGCAFISTEEHSLRLDPDQDGIPWTEDCNEGDPEINVALTWYLDADNDGYGDPNNYVFACKQPEGYLRNHHDCNDDPEEGTQINPEATEECDEIDNNCNELIDDQDPLLSEEYLWFEDADNDGEGSSENSERSCTQPQGWVNNNLDCNDSTPQIASSAVEICDQLDNNCDGNIDENVTQTFYADNDNDGYGDPNAVMELCSLQEGTTNDNTDCNDSSDQSHPYAPEICDELDNNCDGNIDENVTQTFYADNDNDGYGDPNAVMELCSLQEGTTSNNTDCDDIDYYVQPNAPETCDGVDNDCDGYIDDEDPDLDTSSANTYYQDADGDFFGNPDSFVLMCTRPNDYVSNFHDCNDEDPNIHPQASEICDGIDQNCNTIADEAIQSLFYLDSDGDGYGDPEQEEAGCILNDDYVENDEDCDDTDSLIHPLAEEVCDQKDNNCNQLIDTDATGILFEDNDEDGYGDPSLPLLGCNPTNNMAANDEDCDDDDPTINPEEIEILEDGIDQNCSGSDLSCSTPIEEVITSTFDSYSGPCDWTENESWLQQNSLYNGYSQSLLEIDLSSYEHICSIGFNFDSDHAGLTHNQFNFDDHIALTYNDYVLLSTSSDLIDFLVSDNIGPIFDWNNLEGQEMNMTIDEWSLNGTFNLNSLGALNAYTMFFRIPSSSLEDIHTQSIQQEALELKLIGFGDNDQSDCSYEDLNIETHLFLAQ